MLCSMGAALVPVLATLTAALAVSVAARPATQLETRDDLSNLGLCLPPILTSPLTGQYPASAVTTKQTGTDCTQYGDPPAKVVGPILSPTGLEDLVIICGGEIVDLTDYTGAPRKACLYVNPASTAQRPLPLVVWLHPSLVSTSLSFPLTGFDLARDSQRLNSDDDGAVGFSYLLPLGRNTEHKYQFPDNVGLGWDNWYRNLDRTSPDLNVDVDFLDKAIALAKARVPVDPRRVFMSGWSNGAAMALLYALNTDGIAGTSVYSAPDPYRDGVDPCTQAPHPTFATPTQDTHNYCDLVGICTTGKYFYDDLRVRYPRLKQSLVVIDTLTAASKSRDDDAQCDPVCQGTCFLTEGLLAHLRWPATRNNDTFFAFMRQHPLPRAGTWGPPS